ncbi:MAG: AAA family ATPase [Proteobacteria bacterium]|nr:AAA family ATPase [Pseudomonadota bacterium]
MSIEVGEWLKANEFERFIEVFEANEIDGEALLELTEEHLREMGIALGPRLKILKAITHLSASSTAVAPSPPVAEAERRQLTVMFVDLVGSTALSARLDPEDLRDVIRSYQGVIATEVARFGGHIAQYLGDGAFVFFGYPVAYEDAAERAVRTALGLLDAINALRTEKVLDIEVRMGIATGLVVVGDLLGHGDAKENAVLGETPNLAARLQSLALPGQIILAESTRDLTGHLFELNALQALALHGISEPVSAYTVVGERDTETRFEAQKQGPISPIIGRRSELALLRSQWERAASGDGQLVVVSGDPGIGKSRIVRALRDSITASYIRTSYQCSPHRNASTLYPVIQQVLHAAAIRPRDTDAEKLAKLEAILVNTSPRHVEEVALIASLLAIQTHGRYQLNHLTPEQQRARTFDALISQLMHIASSTPLLIVVEDAQWIDPTTLELIEIFGSRIRSSRVMILVTTRSKSQTIFSGTHDVNYVGLNRLGLTDITELIASITRGKKLPEQLIQEIARKTDGVPLFAEELTKVLLESGDLLETLTPDRRRSVVLENANVPCHQVWCGKSKYLPQRKIPGHNSEHNPEWLVNHRTPERVAFDDLGCKKGVCVIGVVVTDPRTFFSFRNATC